MNETTQTITLLELTQLVARAHNRLVGGMPKESLAELAASIKEKGVLQPLIVRLRTIGRQATERPFYEIVAGERRWKAAGMAGLATVPCQVRDMDDAEADEVALIDNLHRAELHPMDEAAAYATIYQQVVNQENAEAGIDVVAGKVGKPVRYVAQRMQLMHLVSSARELWRHNEHMTLGHALLICKLPAHIQDDLVKKLKGPYQFREFQEFIQREVYMELDQAPWKKDDAKLLPGAGPCTTCPKRTGANATLFPEIGKKDVCLDGGCFGKKMAAHLALAQYQLKDLPHLVVSSEYIPKLKGALNQYAWEKCKKDDSDATQCLVVDGANQGRIVWGRKATSGGARAKLTDAEKATRKKGIEQKRLSRRVAVKVMETTLERLRKSILDNGAKEPQDLIRVLAFWIFRRSNNSQRDIGTYLGWSAQKTVHKYASYSYTTTSWEPAAKAALVKMLAPQLYMFMATCLAAGAMQKEPQLTEDLEQLAAVADVEIDQIEKEVRRATAEEKAAKASKPKKGPGPAAKKTPTMGTRSRRDKKAAARAAKKRS